MKKITFFSFLLILFFVRSFAQFGCGSAIALSNGFVQNNITTVGNGGVEDWNQNPTGTTIDGMYWNDDVYMFSYTAGSSDEIISITTLSRNVYNGIGIFANCDGTVFSGPLASASSSSTNATKTIGATVAAGATVYIATGQWGPPKSLDFDVVSFSATPVNGIPNCTTLLTPSNGTTTAAQNGMLKWSAATGTPSTYKIYMGTTSGGTDVLNGVNVGNVLTYNAGVLSANTTYFVKIVPSNSNGDATGCTEYSFTTCGTYDSLFENFDSAATGAASEMPNCWTKLGNGLTYVMTSSIAPFSPPNRLYMSANGNFPNPTQISALTPALSNLQAGTHRLRFKVHATSSNKKMQIGYFTDLSDINTFVTIQEILLPGFNVAAMQEFTIVPGVLPAGVSKLAFRNNAVTGPAIIYIDDVSWEAIPSCGDIVTVKATDFNSTSATLAWEPAESENNWQYVYGSSDTVTDPSLLTAVAVFDEPLILLQSLQPNTTYKIWVRSNCGNGAFGNWPQTPYIFKTTCEPVTSFSETFASYTGMPNTTLASCWTRFGTTGTSYMNSGLLYLSANPVTPTNAYAVMPPLSNLLAGTHQLKFKAHAPGGNKFLELGYFELAGEVSSFVLLETFPLPESSQDASSIFTYEVGMLPSQIESLVFKLKGAGNPEITDIYIDDVMWRLIPACADINEVTVTNVTTDSAAVTWAPMGLETSWQYAFTSTSTTDPNTLAAVTVAVPTVNLLDLQSNTTYKVWVRSTCEGDLYGSWSTVRTFTTQCNPTTLPYTINFEGGTGVSLPSCTSRENAGTGNNWFVATAFDNGFTGTVLQYDYNSFSDANAWFYTNSFYLEAGTQYSVSYKYGNNDAGYTERMKVAFGNFPISTSMTEFIEDHPSISQGTAQNNTAYFSPVFSGTYVIGFNAYSVEDQFSLFLDDIVIQEVLATTNFDANKFTAYPNPVKNNLNIRYNENIKDVAVFNLLGQQLFTKSINAKEGQIDMSGVSSGTYLVKISSADKVQTIKVIKE
ncbi:T9SS type A sorting domain-containing protein [Flavobacterium antarcticum]|uniref:T9SS type A sorting domain-containing protein n=1 Tax=Flavobacterium antarcticum TaxID=271155 RepID=UPI0003B35162|nr:T9SS type A sorting domain-containing protein [Flavobacterium antarcticum]